MPRRNVPTRRAFVGHTVGLTFLSLAAGPTSRARADVVPVDLLLVLAADVSRSLDQTKFRLQREGYAKAITDSRVLGLIKAGPHGRIGIMLVEWSGAGAAAVMIEWTLIDDAASARTFADKILAAPRLFMDRTSISTAIDFSRGQFERAPFTSERRVIDISGDGTHNSGRNLADARNEALGAGIVINGLAILSAVPLAFNPAHTHPPGGLLHYYEENVIGGPGSFALAADGFEDFGQLMVQKLIKEIASIDGIGPGRDRG